MMRARRLVGGSLGALVLVALVAGPASAAASLTVSPPSGVPGQVLHAIGGGFVAGQTISLLWDAGYLSETGRSDRSGAFDIPFAIPPTASSGGHVLRACIGSVCSYAVPFTVSVVAGTPPPVATPSLTASAPPSSEPSPSASAPTESPSPSPAASSDLVSPAPSASASAGLVVPTVVPTVAPTALPGEPKPPGTIKVQFPWDRIGVAAVFALGILLIVVAAANEKWLKGSGGKVFDRGSDQDLTTGSDGSAKTPKLYEAAAKGTHGPAPAPAPPSQSFETTRHIMTSPASTGDAPGVSNPEISNPEISNPEISDPEISNPEISNPNAPMPDAASHDVASPDADPDTDATKDVKLKGKNIGEN